MSPQLALGKSDGKSATLQEFSSLVLVLGREIYDGGSSNMDFRIEGQVDSASVVSKTSCPTNGTGDGAFEVLVSIDGSRFYNVGLWTQEINEFDIGCAQMGAARFIQIRGLPGASGSLDAVSSDSCLTSNKPEIPTP